MIRLAIRTLRTTLLFILIAGPVLSVELRAAERGAPEVHSDISVLPDRVADMRNAILEAARSGDIEALRAVLDSNELKPTVSFGGSDDPIKLWKQTSGDGQGREIMAILAEILEMDFARVNAGTSNEMYVWPYLAEMPLGKLTSAQQVYLYRLMTHDDVKTMKEFGGYINYRHGIGRDGTWNYFVSGD
jgi:hypothetical protein